MRRFVSCMVPSVSALLVLAAPSIAEGKPKDNGASPNATQDAGASGEKIQSESPKPNPSKAGPKRRGGTALLERLYVPSRTTTQAPAGARADYGVEEGRLPEPKDGATCPDGMVSVERRFCVDKYEGSLVQMLPDGTERPWSPYDALPDGVTVRAQSIEGVYPQAYISGEQAQRACARAGKRLCNPVEWRKACKGPEGHAFGYGARREAGRCNDHGKSPMLELYPQVNTNWRLVGFSEMNDPRLNQLAGSLAKTGAHPDCANGYGAVDMVGNLHEWTSDPNGTFQGGYYLDTSKNGEGCSYRTVAHEFTYHDYSTGFRCCADPSVEGDAGAENPYSE